MLNIQKNTGAVIFVISLFGLMTGCSTISQIGKSTRNMTTFGSDKPEMAVDEKLIIPPSLRTSANSSSERIPSKRTVSKPRQKTAKVAYNSNKNYYIIVGTYPDQGEALDTFVRISSIGLKGAAMESRVTKGGKKLHMVRLGPYHKQEDIDKAKDSLTNDGLSQFKVVEN